MISDDFQRFPKNLYTDFLYCLPLCGWYITIQVVYILDTSDFKFEYSMEKFKKFLYIRGAIVWRPYYSRFQLNHLYPAV